MDILAERRRRDAERKRRKRAEMRAQEAKKESEAVVEVCPLPEEAVGPLSVGNNGDTEDHDGDVGTVVADDVVEDAISAFELLRRRREKERR